MLIDDFKAQRTELMLMSSKVPLKSKSKMCSKVEWERERAAAPLPCGGEGGDGGGGSRRTEGSGELPFMSISCPN